MTDETSQVSQGSPPEGAPATTGGAASLTAAMNAVLKAMKPLEALIKSYDQAAARREAQWKVVQPLCVLPETTERTLIERFVMTAEAAYLVWLEAYESTEDQKRLLLAAQEELLAAKIMLNEAIAFSNKMPELEGDKTLESAVYMLTLLERRRVHVEGKAASERKPEALTEDSEIALTKLRAAAIDFLLTEAVVCAKHAVLDPLADEVYSLPNLGNVPLPVRPLEEEIVRYLSNLENNLQRQQELNRRAHPLLKERLGLIAQYEAWDKAWADAVTEAEGSEHKNALLPLIWAFKEIIKQVREKSQKRLFKDHYQYKGFAQDPDQLIIHDRPTSTRVEKDQIDYLRTQFRVVAFAVAHREEATFTLKQTNGNEVKVTPSGVGNVANWAEALAWFEELRKERDAAELETLSRTTKVDLLKKNVEHYTDKVKDELTTLYKSFQAMIPRNGPMPSNELRKLLDMAAWICKPLEKTRDHDY